MTFYWWSHWFWITFFGNLLFSHIVIVHTYPSQESMLQHNSNQQVNSNNLITRLYQSSTATWKIDAPSHYEKIGKLDKLKLQHIEKTLDKSSVEAPINKLKEHLPAQVSNNDEEEYYYDYDATEEKNQKFNLAEMEADLERKENISTTMNRPEPDIDVKRSAENLQNKTVLNQKSKPRIVENVTASALLEANNYTNFTEKLNLTSTNSTAKTAKTATTLIGATAHTTTPTNSSENAVTNTTKNLEETPPANATTQLPQAPSTPKIVKVQMASLDWLNSAAAQLPPSLVTTDATEDGNDEPHKIPFTLENVNKPEDLRREEGEHRTRKSKGLSAEYKVNRYINYSSDTKNLLTRSAATTVNEYDSEESNISSEALSVQRAYFMDVGAISAICFTVFGICCTFATVGIVLYRRRFLNKPQALSEPDSSVYIDDSTMRVSDNSDEMYSLDNDSFLNSLEAMTIQNYWTDTVKHTKL